MRAFLCLVAALTLPVCFAEDAELYEHYLELAFNKTDTNKDGLIQCTEFNNLIVTLDLECAAVEKKEESRRRRKLSEDVCIAETECDLADTNDDNAVSEDEMVAYIQDESLVSDAKKEAVIMALTGVSLEMDGLDDIGEVNPAIEEAVAKVVLQITSSENPDSMLPGDRKAVKRAIETVLGLPQDSDALFLTFLAGSTVVTATAFYPSTADADAAEATAMTQLATPALATAALGIPVTTAPVIETAGVAGQNPIAYFIIGAAGGGAFVLFVIAIIIASVVSGKTGKAKGAPPGGCCQRGCCSAYALKGWSANVLLGVIFMVAGVLLLFIAMAETKDALICIIDGVYDLKESTIVAVKDATDAIPTDQIDSIRPYMQYLDIAVIVPGALAALVVVIASACSCRNIPTMCCSKFFMGLGYVLLFLCLVFYIIFAALAIVINLDMVQEQVKTFTSICETTMPGLNQKIQDITLAINKADEMGMDVTEYQTELDTYSPAATTFTSMCTCIDDLLSSFTGLFLPGMLTVCAIIYLYIATITMCCSAKCCKAPLVTAADGGDAAGAPSIAKPVQEV